MAHVDYSAAGIPVRGDLTRTHAEPLAHLRALLTPEAFVDAAAVIGAFNVVDRIANATGIPLDAGLAAMSGEVREELDLVRFGSSANTPRADRDRQPSGPGRSSRDAQRPLLSGIPQIEGVRIEARCTTSPAVSPGGGSPGGSDPRDASSRDRSRTG